MAKEYICGLTARKRLGCDKEFFMKLVNTGQIEATRTESGSWQVSSTSIDEYLAGKDPIAKLEHENMLLREEIEHYKKLLRGIKRILPKEI